MANTVESFIINIKIYKESLILCTELGGGISYISGYIFKHKIKINLQDISTKSIHSTQTWNKRSHRSLCKTALLYTHIAVYKVGLTGAGEIKKRKEKGGCKEHEAWLRQLLSAIKSRPPIWGRLGAPLAPWSCPGPRRREGFGVIWVFRVTNCWVVNKVLLYLFTQFPFPPLLESRAV